MPEPTAEPTVYSEDDLDRIIKAVGKLPPGPVRHGDPHSGRVNIDENAPLEDRRAELRFMLEAIAHYHRQLALLEDALQLASSRKRLHSQYQGVLRAIDDFECALSAATPNILPGPDGRRRIGVIADSHAPPEPNWSLLRQILAQAHAWAEWHCSVAPPLEPSGHGGRRWRPPTQLYATINYLGAIYHHVFEKPPGQFSEYKGKVVGPFARYLCACLGPLLGDKMPSPQVLRSIWRRRRSAMAESSFGKS